MLVFALGAGLVAGPSRARHVVVRDKIRRRNRRAGISWPPRKSTTTTGPAIATLSRSARPPGPDAVCEGVSTGKPPTSDGQGAVVRDRAKPDGQTENDRNSGRTTLP